MSAHTDLMAALDAARAAGERLQVELEEARTGQALVLAFLGLAGEQGALREVALGHVDRDVYLAARHLLDVSGAESYAREISGGGLWIEAFRVCRGGITFSAQTDANPPSISPAAEATP